MTKATRRGIFIIGVIVIGLMLIGFMARTARRPTTGSVLQMTVHGGIAEWTGDESLSDIIGSRPLVLRDYLEAIYRASTDERINGLLVTIDNPALGFARLQEIRDAVLQFRESGRWAAAYMETAGEFSPGNAAYYLATAFDSIWLAPPGDINLVGLRAEVPFVRGVLDKLKVVADMDHIGDYKSAMNFFTHREMTDAHREALEAVIASMYGQIRGGIAIGRDMSEEAVDALIDRGPFLGPQALEENLVDRLGYFDEMKDHLEEENGGRLPLLTVRRYLKGGRYYDSGPRVALIHGIGSVLRGENAFNPLTGQRVMGSDTISKAIRDAREDPTIMAIVFRVDSPGGSYVASDIIWREVMLTRGVKPIVVSMSNVAGSGGYFVAMAADRIYAQPGTITASIGVLAGKFVTTELWNALGVTSDSVQRGRHATFFSNQSVYSTEERAIFRGWLERIYNDFVGKVAEGRDKTFDEIHAIAQGRIWSGEDALRLGLIDGLGGLSAAVSAALELAGEGTADRAQLVEFPEPKNWLESFTSRDRQTQVLIDTLRIEIERITRGGPFPGPERVLEMPYVPGID